MDLIYVSSAAAALFAAFFVRQLMRSKDLHWQLLQVKEKAQLVDEYQQRLLEQSQELTQLKILAASSEEKLRYHQEAEQTLKESFKALSTDVLEQNSKSFLERAKLSFENLQQEAKGELDKRKTAIDEVLKPVKETLGKLDDGLRSLEKERKGEHEVLKEQLKVLGESEKALRQETAGLVRALRSPASRGRWGELQLKRVVELAGMLEHCDFFEQVVIDTESRHRPDLVIHLSGGRNVIIDAKTPLEAYLDALATDNEELKLHKLKEHARHIRDHVQELSKKAYWEKFPTAPEFVVLFLPSETIFSAALEQDGSLIELGAEQRVILATPTTLIALLRAVAFGWKQEKLSEKAAEISQLGADLYKRLSDLGGHFSKLGKSLNSAVESYNKAVGSLESRVLVSARRFEHMGLGSDTIEIEQLEPIVTSSRELSSPQETS